MEARKVDSRAGCAGQTPVGCQPQSVIDGFPAHPRRHIRPYILGLAGLAAVLVGVAGYGWSRAELVRVEHDLQAGRPAAARARLRRLTALGLGGVEAKYWRGAVAEAEGQVDTA